MVRFMEQSIIKKILEISCCFLLIAGLLFMVLVICGNTQDNKSVILAMGCFGLAGIFGIIQGQFGAFNV